MFHIDCDCCDHSTPVIIPPSKETEIKFPEDTTCNLTMKVNLGTEPKLFLIVMGRFYLIDRLQYDGVELFLRHYIKYHSSLIFDETGKLYKNAFNAAQYIQSHVDSYGVDKLLETTVNLSGKYPSEYYPIIRRHINSVRRYRDFNETLAKFNI